MRFMPMPVHRLSDPYCAPVFSAIGKRMSGANVRPRIT